MPDPNLTDPIATTYPSTNGPHTTYTYWNGSELGNEWWQRHKDHVRADMLGEFPLVVPTP